MEVGKASKTVRQWLYFNWSPAGSTRVIEENWPVQTSKGWECSGYEAWDNNRFHNWKAWGLDELQWVRRITQPNPGIYSDWRLGIFQSGPRWFCLHYEIFREFLHRCCRKRQSTCLTPRLTLKPSQPFISCQMGIPFAKAQLFGSSNLSYSYITIIVWERKPLLWISQFEIHVRVATDIRNFVWFRQASNKAEKAKKAKTTASRLDKASHIGFV